MSYCACSSSLNRGDFLPGVTSISDGRRTFSGRTTVAASHTSDLSRSMQIPIPTSISFHNQPPASKVIDGEWNTYVIHGQCPEMKSGQTIVYWPDGNAIICVYGKNKDETYSQEFWKLPLDTMQWEKIDLKIPDGFAPRAACGCVVVNSKMYMFGGITSSSNFVQDYHIIDLDTNEVIIPETTGELPPPCALPMVVFYDKFLIVWSGTSGSNLSNLHILNVETNVWREIKTDFVGRKSACGCILGSTLYIYGASCPMSILTLDLVTFTFNVITTTGIEPQHNCECLTMIPSNPSSLTECTNILAFETSSYSSTTTLYFFDSVKSSWMSGSISITSGSHNHSNENLLLEKSRSQTVLLHSNPKIVFYNQHERKLLSLSSECAYGEQVEQTISELPIGKMISSLNQRNDFLSALQTGI